MKDILRKLYTLKIFGFRYISEDYLKIASFDKFDSLDKLNYQVCNCSLCELSKYKKNSFCLQKKAKILVILENPSLSSDESGEIFTANLGINLKNILQETKILDFCQIVFLIKCPIHTTKFSYKNSLRNCLPYLFDEIRLSEAKFIITMGENVANAIFGDIEPLQISHGTIFKINNFSIMPTYEISFVLKNPSKMEEFKKDLDKFLQIYLEKTASASA